jgi:hypothetical protein
MVLARASLGAGPQPPSRVEIGGYVRRRCAPLTGTNPRWCCARMRRKTWSRRAANSRTLPAIEAVRRGERGPQLLAEKLGEGAHIRTH